MFPPSAPKINIIFYTNFPCSFRWDRSQYRAQVCTDSNCLVFKITPKKQAIFHPKSHLWPPNFARMLILAPDSENLANFTLPNISEILKFGTGLAEPGLANKVTFLLYFTPKSSSWAQSDPLLHHFKWPMGAGIVFMSWGEVQTCLQTENLKNVGLKRIFRPKPLCTA